MESQPSLAPACYLFLWEVELGSQARIGKTAQRKAYVIAGQEVQVQKGFLCVRKMTGIFLIRQAGEEVNFN